MAERLDSTDVSRAVAIGEDRLIPSLVERRQPDVAGVLAQVEDQPVAGNSDVGRRAAGAPGLYLVIIRMNAFLHDKTPFKETLIISRQ